MNLNKAVLRLGERAVDILSSLGNYAIFTWETLIKSFGGLPDRKLLMKQFYQVGVLSLPVVLLTGGFTGMVLAVQSYYQLHKVTLDTAIGILVGLSMTNELGPVLTALMVAGRVGASMAAELGTMRVTEQIDALQVMACDPIRYLMVPRFLACLFMVPLLTVFSIFIGIMGGYYVGVKLLHINQTFFMTNMLDFTEIYDLLSGLIKSVFFAMLIVTISCYKGFTTEHGAEGVGKATTQAVVFSCISILISDFFLSIILF